MPRPRDSVRGLSRTGHPGAPPCPRIVFRKPQRQAGRGGARRHPEGTPLESIAVHRLCVNAEGGRHCGARSPGREGDACCLEAGFQKRRRRNHGNGSEGAAIPRAYEGVRGTESDEPAALDIRHAVVEEPHGNGRIRGGSAGRGRKQVVKIESAFRFDSRGIPNLHFHDESLVLQGRRQHAREGHFIAGGLSGGGLLRRPVVDPVVYGKDSVRGLDRSCQACAGSKGDRRPGLPRR